MASTDNEFVIGATIVKYGLFESAVAEKKKNEGLPYSSYEEKATIMHLQTTDIIKGKIGIEFGISYVVNSVNQIHLMAENQSIEIKTVVIYPSPGIRDVENNKIYHDSITYRDVPMDAEVYEGYFIGGETDIVAGEWTFQIWHNDHKLAEKIFDITKDK